MFGLKNHNPDLLETNQIFQDDVLNLSKHFGSMKFDVIHCKNVLEHVIDPDLVIDLIKDHLTDGGICILEIPNDYSCVHNEAFSAIDGSFYPIFVPPEHLHYFNTKSIIHYMNNKNVNIVDAFCDYPIDHLILVDELNYYNNKEIGPVAHKLRKKVFNLLALAPFDETSGLLRSFFKSGIGRDMSIIFTNSI